MVWAFSRVSTVDSCKHVLVVEGVFLINYLIRVLNLRSGLAKEKSFVALHAMSFSKENAIAIGSRRGIASLLEICQWARQASSQAFAAGMLRNLARFHEIRQN
uniref:Putative vacuolar protein 8 n=1 Tax=Davidia involucrata TaxID=16924 RepID=A0A5B7BJY5_DAVIN